MQKPAKLINTSVYVYSAAAICIFLNACQSSDDSNPASDPADPNRVLSGLLYYSGASQMNRYDFSTRQEHLLFADGSNYAISGTGDEFVWYKSSPFDRTTRIQIHTIPSPEEHQVIHLDVELESTPKIAANSQVLAALTESTEQPYNRMDMLVFDRESKRIGWLYNIKDFCFTPDGIDLVASAEVSEGGRTIYGLI